VSVKHVEYRLADIADDGHGQACRARELAAQRCDGALAVRAGNRQHTLRRPQCTREELDVTDQLGAARHGGGNRRMILRQPRADNDRCGIGERRVGDRSAQQRDMRQLGGEPRCKRRLGAGIRDANARAVARCPARGREPGQAQAQHDDIAILHH